MNKIDRTEPIYLLGEHRNKKLFAMRTKDWLGIVYSNTPEQLYWQIDEHCDPFVVELAAICKRDNGEFSFSFMVQDHDYFEIHSGEELAIDYLFNQGGEFGYRWFTPQWGQEQTLVADYE